MKVGDDLLEVVDLSTNIGWIFRSSCFDQFRSFDYML